MLLVNYVVPYNLQYSYPNPSPNSIHFNHNIHSYNPVENRMFGDIFRRREDLLIPNIHGHTFFTQPPAFQPNNTLYGKFLKDPIHPTNYFL